MRPESPEGHTLAIDITTAFVRVCDPVRPPVLSSSVKSRQSHIDSGPRLHSTA